VRAIVAAFSPDVGRSATSPDVGRSDLAEMAGSLITSNLSSIFGFELPESLGSFQSGAVAKPPTSVSYEKV
jgi:hypothetical protein